jgi:hypothetical protein
VRFQWDIRENRTVVQYDEHLGPVNSVPLSRT